MVKKSKQDSVKEQVEVLENREQAFRKKWDKRDTRSAYLFFAIFGTLAIACAITGDWYLVFINATFGLWNWLVWRLSLQINQKNYSIGMLIGLHEIQTQAIEEATTPKKDGAKRASANA